MVGVYYSGRLSRDPYARLVYTRTSAKDWLLMHVLVVWAITRNSMFPVLSCMAWDILSVQSFFGSIDQHFQQVAGLLTIEEHGLNSGVFRSVHVL
ncbi:hypothetical protein Tco_1189656 [Tanacetum coccineum]